MKTRTCVLLLVCLALSVSFAFAGWDKKPEFRWMQLFHYDEREDIHRYYNNRLSAMFTYLDDKEEPLFKITPFFEARLNTAEGLWERKEIGLEIGKDILPWIYFGNAFQYAWTKEDFRFLGAYEKRNIWESVTRLMFHHDLLDNKYIKLKGFVLDEYTYDFDLGRGIRNDVAIGVVAPIGKYWEAGLNWRHIDRVTYYDSDTFETSVTLVF